MKKSLYLMLLVLPLAVSPVYADDDEDGTGLLMKNLLTRAGIVGDKKEIKYQERPPLVLPPSVTGKGTSNLPTPSQTASTQSKNWPIDPNAQSELKAAERAKKPASHNINHNVRKLTPDELKAGKVAVNTGTTSTHFDGSSNPTVGQGSLFRSRKDEEARIDFKGEAPRTSLIQPPPGYKTPSKNQPYGPIGKTDYGVIAVENKNPKQQ